MNKGFAIVHIDQRTDKAQQSFSDKLTNTDSIFDATDSGTVNKQTFPIVFQNLIYLHDNEMIQTPKGTKCWPLYYMFAFLLVPFSFYHVYKICTFKSQSHLRAR